MMTKRELIEALEKSAAPDDARIVIWVDGYWDDLEADLVYDEQRQLAESQRRIGEHNA